MGSESETYVTIKVSQYVLMRLKRLMRKLKAKSIDELLDWMLADWEYGGGGEVEQ